MPVSRQAEENVAITRSCSIQAQLTNQQRHKTNRPPRREEVDFLAKKTLQPHGLRTPPAVGRPGWNQSRKACGTVYNGITNGRLRFVLSRLTKAPRWSKSRLATSESYAVNGKRFCGLEETRTAASDISRCGSVFPRRVRSVVTFTRRTISTL